ncbi:MAG TPA: FeoC-like transcriptional regulator [Anaerolineae bacterium]|nr:FeoC-like transcriptional regulator [Anaerolineae bacterium]
MLERLLVILGQSGAVSYGDLARGLGVDQELVQQMVEHLARLGYLRPVAGSCGEGCKACPVEDHCLSGGSDQIWTLTEQGRRAAREAGQLAQHGV